MQPNVSLREAYEKIRSWYRRRIPQASLREILSYYPSYFLQSISLIETLPPASSLSDLEIRVVLEEVLRGALEWGYHGYDGEYEMAQYVYAALAQVGRDFRDDEKEQLKNSKLYPFFSSSIVRADYVQLIVSRRIEELDRVIKFLQGWGLWVWGSQPFDLAARVGNRYYAIQVKAPCSDYRDALREARNEAPKLRPVARPYRFWPIVVAVGGNQTNLFRLWLFDVAEESKDPRLIATGEGQKVSLEPLDLHEGRKCSVVPC
jgi:hypothetical protein